MSGIQGTFVDLCDQDYESAINSARKVARRFPRVRGYRDVTYHRALPWIRLYSAGTEELEYLSRVISVALDRRVVAIECPTNVAALTYFHFESGVLRRALASGFEEGVWGQVEGEPELWEMSCWLKGRPAAPGGSIDGSLSELSDQIFAYYRLPTVDQEVVPFGPPWPLRMLGVFW